VNVPDAEIAHQRLFFGNQVRSSIALCVTFGVCWFVQARYYLLHEV